MPRPKKKVTIKERKPRQKRKPKTLTGGNITEGGNIDEQLRKELFCYTNNNCSVDDRIEDAKKLYDYVKGNSGSESYPEGAYAPKTQQEMNATPIPEPVAMTTFPEGPSSQDPQEATREHVRSKFDRLSM